MRSISIRVCALVLLSGAACAFAARETAIGEDATAKPPASGGNEFSNEQVAFFEKQVQPILKARCLKCHGAEEKIKGGLRLSGRAAVLKGGDQGAAVDLDKPAESLLIQAINYD